MHPEVYRLLTTGLDGVLSLKAGTLTHSAEFFQPEPVQGTGSLQMCSRTDRRHAHVPAEQGCVCGRWKGTIKDSVARLVARGVDILVVLTLECTHFQVRIPEHWTMSQC